MYPYEVDILVLDELADGGLSAMGRRPGTDSSVTTTLEGGFVLIRVVETPDRDLIYRVDLSDLGNNRFVANAERVMSMSSVCGLGYPAEAFRAADRAFVERQFVVLHGRK